MLICTSPLSPVGVPSGSRCWSNFEECKKALRSIKTCIKVNPKMRLFDTKITAAYLESVGTSLDLYRVRVDGEPADIPTLQEQLDHIEEYKRMHEEFLEGKTVNRSDERGLQAMLKNDTSHNEKLSLSYFVKQLIRIPYNCMRFNRYPNPCHRLGVSFVPCTSLRKYGANT
jgi:hypothetical protein